MIKLMEETIGEWDVRGRISCIGLALSYQRLLRASELFAGRKRGGAPGLLLEEGEIAFVEKGAQLGRDRTRAADTVEVQFKGGEGDKDKNGVVMVRICLLYTSPSPRD